MKFHRGTSAQSGNGLAICEGATVVAIVQGGGFPTGRGNCPASDRIANLFEASPDLLEGAKALLAELDGARNLTAIEVAQETLREAVSRAERRTFNPSTGWDYRAAQPASLALSA